MSICINEIKNEHWKRIALDSDVSKDNYLDASELSVFIQNIQESRKNDDRAELSWGEIGTIGLTKAKEFVKGMFCNDEGKFSLGKTLVTA